MAASSITYPVNRRQAFRDASSFRFTCSDCGLSGGECGELVITIDGMRIGERHISDPGSGYYGTPYASDEAGERK